MVNLLFTTIFCIIQNIIVLYRIGDLSEMALTPQQISELLKLRAIGWSQKEIAEKLETSQQVIAYQSMKSGPDDVFAAAILGGLAGVAGGFALAMLLKQLTKE